MDKEFSQVDPPEDELPTSEAAGYLEVSIGRIP
jgi:hypothetical protein